MMSDKTVIFVIASGGLVLTACWLILLSYGVYSLIKVIF
jgi:hypothetical protein